MIRWVWVVVFVLLANLAGFVAGRGSVMPELERMTALSSQWGKKARDCEGASEFREYVITQCLESYNSRVGEKLEIHLEDFIKKRMEKILQE